MVRVVVEDFLIEKILREVLRCHVYWICSTHFFAPKLMDELFNGNLPCDGICLRLLLILIIDHDLILQLGTGALLMGNTLLGHGHLIPLILFDQVFGIAGYLEAEAF